MPTTGQSETNKDIRAEIVDLVASQMTSEIEDKLLATIQRMFEPAARVALLNEKEFLTEKEVGDLFSIAPSTLRTERSRGIGPGYVKDGKKVLYSRKDLIAYFKNRLVRHHG
ncbi:hypothetical protein C4J81_06400 [Deltaproteobacteria bacterium Smac51]|nr:hypothetical protein C4J81_06400 [Deltaproteobacteria bacterium Smac51]